MKKLMVPLQIAKIWQIDGNLFAKWHSIKSNSVGRMGKFAQIFMEKA